MDSTCPGKKNTMTDRCSAAAAATACAARRATASRAAPSWRPRPPRGRRRPGPHRAFCRRRRPPPSAAPSSRGVPFPRADIPGGQRRQRLCAGAGPRIIQRMAAATPGPDELFIAALHLDHPRRSPFTMASTWRCTRSRWPRIWASSGRARSSWGWAGSCTMGMARIPEAVVHRPGALGEEERKTLRRRPAAA